MAFKIESKANMKIVYLRPFAEVPTLFNLIFGAPLDGDHLNPLSRTSPPLSHPHAKPE
jgi:hypothetical protein